MPHDLTGPDLGDEMDRALKLDGEKLHAMTGKDHGPWAVQSQSCSISVPQFRCERGHEGPINLSTWIDGKLVAQCCGICFAQDLAAKYPVTPKE